MIPLTHQEVKCQDSDCTDDDYYQKAAKYVTLHGVISTLLLPLTVYVISGQYGVLISTYEVYGQKGVSYQELLTLTDMSITLQVFLISLLSLGHLSGFISAYKESALGLLLNCLFRFCEIMITVEWNTSVGHSYIKSHFMSQTALGCYCFFSLATQMACLCYIFRAAVVFRKHKGE